MTTIDTVQERQNKNKELVIDQLKRTPVIEVACKKIGIGRATFYRWRKEDKVFAEQADESLSAGVKLISDMAESQLITAIKERNMTAIIFWLKHHHAKYTTRVEVTAEVKNLNQQLTPEQQQVVEEALRLASLTDSSESRKE